MFKQENFIFTILVILVIIGALALLIYKSSGTRMISNDKILFEEKQISVHNK